MADFLLEIGTEEIPAGMIRELAWSLAGRVIEALGASSLWTGGDLVADPGRNPFERLAGGRMIAAPRRIGFLLPGLPVRQPDRRETVVGPAMAVARDAGGKWTKAAEGFARKQGVDLADCREVQGPKGLCVGFERTVKGRPTEELLAEVVPGAVDALHLAKAMRWGSGSQTFVRPVRWVAALLDDQVVPLSIKGVTSGRTSRGHRIHGAAEVEIPSAQAYFQALRGERVLADPADRKRKIEEELSRHASALGGHVHGDPELLQKLVYLCEFPTVLAGGIPPEYLALPSEILVTCLREHQNFFVVRGAGDAVSPHFLSVMDGPDDPKGFIRRGLENVSRSRLSDARFFYEQDLKVPLEERLEALKGIVFHPQLGSYYDKALRMESLARRLAALFGANAEEAAWAAKHCKCDLASLLVQEKEFTSLQGVAGGIYAAAQGRPQTVADAIYDHYRPLFMEDDLPRGAVGACVALADKLDSLVEMFRIGQAPTGSKDPFALRRAGMGVMRILVDHPDSVSFDLRALLASLGPIPDGLMEFLEGRLRFLWEQGRRVDVLEEPPSVLDHSAHQAALRALAGGRGSGFPYDEINAVLAAGTRDRFDPWLLDLKLKQFHGVRNGAPEDFDHLAVAFKRAKNILRGMPESPLDPRLFLPESDKEGAAERALFSAYEAVKDGAEERFAISLYGGGLLELARLRPAVDRFFDDVLVMCDPEGKDPAKSALQRNRLALLQRLVALFDRVADFSEIVPRETAAGK
ncbi:MAG: glycine--tRNA ligase subunit beta [Acidobacteriota bacterium]